MTVQARPAIPARHAAGLVRATQVFVGVALVTLLFSGGLAWLLMRVFGRPHAPTLFPPAFAVSTLLLLGGSLSLNKALYFVRIEKQQLFRRWLLLGLLCGGLFMGFQTFGLWTLFPEHRNPEDASLGVTAFAMALTTLHGLHFLIATLFVSFVISRAWGDRYDHEYHWGVTVCAWFWHALGIVWMAILAVFAISKFQA